MGVCVHQQFIHIHSQLFIMSASKEKTHDYKVITKALMKALTKVLTEKKGSRNDSLKPPTFNWNSSDQYKDF